MTVLQFITREKPYFEESFADSQELKEAVKNGDRPSFPKNEQYCPTSLYLLVQACWEQDPKQRPTFQQILQSFEEDFLVDSAIMEFKSNKEFARDFWKNNFGCQSKNQNLLIQVPFQIFFSCFQTSFPQTEGSSSLLSSVLKCKKFQNIKNVFLTIKKIFFVKMIWYCWVILVGFWVILFLWIQSG